MIDKRLSLICPGNPINKNKKLNAVGQAYGNSDSYTRGEGANDNPRWCKTCDYYSNNLREFTTQSQLEYILNGFCYHYFTIHGK